MATTIHLISQSTLDFPLDTVEAMIAHLQRLQDTVGVECFASEHPDECELLAALKEIHPLLVEINNAKKN